jgi:hypothetical protein
VKKVLFFVFFLFLLTFSRTNSSLFNRSFLVGGNLFLGEIVVVTTRVNTGALVGVGRGRGVGRDDGCGGLSLILPTVGMGGRTGGKKVGGGGSTTGLSTSLVC